MGGGVLAAVPCACCVLTGRQAGRCAVMLSFAVKVKDRGRGGGGRGGEGEGGSIQVLLSLLTAGR